MTTYITKSHDKKDQSCIKLINLYVFKLLFLIFLFTYNNAKSQIVNEFLKKIDGPSGGAILCVSQSGQYVGTYGGGIYQISSNGWRKITLNLEIPQQLSWTAIIETNDSTVIAIAGSYYIVRSTDKGESWEIAYEESNAFNSVVYSPKSGNLIVGSYFGIFFSKDNGQNWQYSESEIGDIEIRDIFNYRDSLLYAVGSVIGGGSYLLRSSDYGISWAKLGLQYFPDRFLSIAAIEETIFTGTIRSGLMKSSNLGTSWTKVNNSPSRSPILDIFAPNVSSLFLGTKLDGLVYTSDAGLNWQSVDSFDDKQVNFINGNFIGTYGKGIYKWTDYDISSLKAINDNLDASIINSILRIDNYIFVGTEGSGIFRADLSYLDPEVSWNNLRNGFGIRIGNYVYSFANDKQGSIYAGTAGDGLFKSYDNGDSWELILNPNKAAYIGDIVVLDSIILITTSQEGILRSDDNGTNWLSVNNGWDTTISKYVPTLEVLPDGDILASIARFGIYRSSDKGLTWISSNQGIESRIIMDIILNPDGVIFASGLDMGIYKSSDNGLSWILEHEPDYYPDYKTMAFYPTNVLNIGSISGALIKRDESGNWDTYENFLSTNSINVLYTEPIGGLIIGTDGDGLYYYTESTSVEEEEFEIISLGNYYEILLSMNSPLNFTVYNLMGNALISGTYEANQSSAQISALPNGVYLLQITFNEKRSFKLFMKN